LAISGFGFVLRVRSHFCAHNRRKVIYEHFCANFSASIVKLRRYFVTFEWKFFLNVNIAEQAERQIRAFEIFPKSKIQIGENLLIVNSAKVVNENSNNSPLTIKFSDGKFLQIEKITAPSGKQMPAESYINGYLK
jgi:hypothetical protein